MPHTLVMTATPIPRSLALTIYGDLDVSVIDEMPPGRQADQDALGGRQPPRSRPTTSSRRRWTRGGRRSSSARWWRSRTRSRPKPPSAEHERLQAEVFPDYAAGAAARAHEAGGEGRGHGRLPPPARPISWSPPAVVEVGIDVPNATVMLIEGADRFGLSQLHQFRGRVGRGEHQSYCILLAENAQGVAFERMQIIQETHDGFQLAEEDLRDARARASSSARGNRGMPDLRMAKLSDMATLTLAREQAKALFARDPQPLATRERSPQGMCWKPSGAEQRQGRISSWRAFRL